jgi:hypothetical protein
MYGRALVVFEATPESQWCVGAATITGAAGGTASACPAEVSGQAGQPWSSVGAAAAACCGRGEARRRGHGAGYESRPSRGGSVTRRNSLNDAHHWRRAKRVQHGTERLSRRRLQHACWGRGNSLVESTASGAHKPALLDQRGQEPCGAKEQEPIEDPTLLRWPILSVSAVWTKLAHGHPQRQN